MVTPGDKNLNGRIEQKDLVYNAIEMYSKVCT